MVVIDRLNDDSPPLPEGFTAFSVVGLDATIVERGVMIGTAGDPPSYDSSSAQWIVRTFVPVHPPRFPTPPTSDERKP
jgi:hypothetical protein